MAFRFPQGCRAYDNLSCSDEDASAQGLVTMPVVTKPCGLFMGSQNTDYADGKVVMPALKSMEPAAALPG